MKTFSRVFGVVAILAVFVFLFFIYNITNAITTTTATDISSGDYGGGGLRLKQSSAFAPVIKVQFGSNEDGKTLNALSVGFTGPAGTPTWPAGAASSELLDLATTNGGISLWRETGGGPGFQSASDTQITLATAPVYSATNIFSLIPVAPPTLVTDNIYYVVLKSDTSGVTNNNAFTVTVPANGITTNTAPPTITALTTQAITIDTVAPTITATGPANSAV
ncbi:MAG: hypothetical protein AAB569_06450, partial [Patescibacteria group bacterium]